MSLSPRIAKFPAKFPDTREFAWRLVRSALRRQPSIPGLREKAADSSRKARQQRAFAIWRSVLCAPISWNEDQIRRKSLTNAANIPVFGRRRAEIGFDQALRGDAKQAGKARRSSHR